MSVLIGDKLIEALENGEIKVDPLDKSCIGPGSIDLTLGNDFRIFKKQINIYHLDNNSNFEDITELVNIKDSESIVINPGEMILGITKEIITLSDDISGWLEGRSRFARFGLAVHITAGFMNPGISNKQVLEIVNMGNTPIALYPGTKICQFIFERCEGRAKYNGRFGNQTKP
ncbi:dCTP deaminase [Candidatus Gracilibacteria bacterium]|nr:dCTP deaminase [Candidatus Gracilibacteria bacterium]